MSRSSLGAVLLVVGYAVAVAALVRLPAIYRERRTRRLMVAMMATVTVCAGWALREEPLGVALNAINLFILAAAWWLTRPRATTGARPGPRPRGRG